MSGASLTPARLLTRMGPSPPARVGVNNYKKGTKVTDENNTEKTDLFTMLERFDRPMPDELRASLADALSNMEEFHSKFMDLRSTVIALRNDKNWADTQRDRAMTQQRFYLGQFEGTKALLLRERAELQGLIETAYANEPKFEFDSPQVECYLEIAYRAGILAGQHAEAHRLAMEVDDYRSGQRDKYDEISRELRTAEGGFPDPVSIPEAVAKAIRAVSPGVHSLDPRLSEFWERLHELAKRRAGFCEVYEQMCEALGTPEVPFQTKSGTITVRATFDIEVPISEAPVDEHGSVEYDIDSTDIFEALDRYAEVNDWEILDEDLDWD